MTVGQMTHSGANMQISHVHVHPVRRFYRQLFLKMQFFFLFFFYSLIWCSLDQNSALSLPTSRIKTEQEEGCHDLHLVISIDGCYGVCRGCNV